ncbi:hypothetical protein V6N13_081255 [Hibiscus sabdariffa]
MQSPMPVASAVNNSAADTGPTTHGVGTKLAPKAPASTDPSSSPVPVSRAPLVPASDAHDLDPYDPMVHTDTSDMLEDSLDDPSDCALLMDIDGIIQATGDDLVHGALDEVADSLIREVAASRLPLGTLPVKLSAIGPGLRN